MHVGNIRVRAAIAGLLLAACIDAPSAPRPTPAALSETAVAGSPTLASVTRVQGNWQITMTDLGFLPGGTFSSAYDINNIGEVVGVASDAGGMNRRVIWQNGVMVDTLPKASAATTTAWQLNESRQFVGVAVINSKFDTACSGIMALPSRCSRSLGAPHREPLPTA